MKTFIAVSAPLSGFPKITVPFIFGASPDKPFLMRISVLGERPMTINVENIPDGISLEGNMLVGTAPSAGEYPITVFAENKLGKAKKDIVISVAPDGALRTPLLGFTTWNAFASAVEQKNVEDTADYFIESGISEYGYSYINLDSGWQDNYGGEYDAIMPNANFPDMKGMYDKLHSLGFKGGIYSSPFMQAWGCPDGVEYIPGCTRGERDIRFPDENTGIGLDRREAACVRQWCDWGVDYLKYDWKPTEPVNADLMKTELLKASRDIPMCVTVAASDLYKDYWNKNCCSWRWNDDTWDEWNNILERFKTLDRWRGKTSVGHFYDLDMLAIGVMHWSQGRLTDEEELTAFTLHSFFPSPVQLSMQMDKLSETEKRIIGNEDMISVNQDILCDYPEHLPDINGVTVYRRKLVDGKAYAFFNLSDKSVSFDYKLDADGFVYNVWEKRSQGLGFTNIIKVELDPHESAVFKIR